MRGTVLPLMGSERLQRMRYLGRLATIDTLDRFVNRDGVPQYCPDIYYLLRKHNGGKDPRASDPATRWRKPFRKFTNITCDCMGAMAWCGGFDRYQPERFSHIYDGWINTDSMRKDAAGPKRCFRRLDRPEPGCFVVFATGARGAKCGHVGGVLEVPDTYAPQYRSWWQQLKVVDVAKRDPHRANEVTNGLTWYDRDSWFVIPVMT